MSASAVAAASHALLTSLAADGDTLFIHAQQTDSRTKLIEYVRLSLSLTFWRFQVFLDMVSVAMINCLGSITPSGHRPAESM